MQGVEGWAAGSARTMIITVPGNEEYLGSLLETGEIVALTESTCCPICFGVVPNFTMLPLDLDVCQKASRYA